VLHENVSGTSRRDRPESAYIKGCELRLVGRSFTVSILPAGGQYPDRDGARERPAADAV